MMQSGVALAASQQAQKQLNASTAQRLEEASAERVPTGVPRR